MKKQKFLILALVVATMLMGAGYAAWSQTLTVGTTVQTGEFKLEMDAEKSMTTDFTGFEMKMNDKKDTVEFKATDLYPGACNDETIWIKNTGTVPVNSFNTKVTDDGKVLLLEGKDVPKGAVIYVDVYDKKGNPVNEPGSIRFDKDYNKDDEANELTGVDTYNQAQMDLFVALQKACHLDPKESFKIVVQHRAKSWATEKTYPENASYSFNLNMVGAQ